MHVRHQLDCRFPGVCITGLSLSTSLVSSPLLGYGLLSSPGGFHVLDRSNKCLYALIGRWTVRDDRHKWAWSHPHLFAFVICVREFMFENVVWVWFENKHGYHITQSELWQETRNISFRSFDILWYPDYLMYTKSRWCHALERFDMCVSSYCGRGLFYLVGQCAQSI